MIDHHHHHHKVSNMASSGGKVIMEKQQAGQEVLQQQQALKCPRCDSSNTKFCYYNNYSLSQPRHFCKACKRYWTRGGTLRNVPVGGGCRKNKRLKRQTQTQTQTIDSTSTSSPSPSSNPSTPTTACANSHPSSQNSNHHINHPLFYGLPSNNNYSCDVLNLIPFPAGFSTARASISSDQYDLHQLNALAAGLSFSSSGIDINGYRNINNNGGGFSSNNNTFLSAYNSIFGSSSSTSSLSCTPTTTVMASLLSSSLAQQKFMGGSGVKIDGVGSNTTFQGLAVAPLEEEMQLRGNNINSSTTDEAAEGGRVVVMASSKEVKGELLGEDWNQMDQQQQQHMGFSDPSIYWSTPTAFAAANWSDNQPNNISSNSVTSLI